MNKLSREQNTCTKCDGSGSVRNSQQRWRVCDSCCGSGTTPKNPELSREVQDVDRCVCDHFEHKPTGECVTCGMFCGPVSNAVGVDTMRTWAGHVLFTKETCPCDKQSDSSCNICDGGLAICSICGKAEAELAAPCKPAQDTESGVSPAVSVDTVAGSLPHQSESESSPLQDVDRCVKCGDVRQTDSQGFCQRPEGNGLVCGCLCKFPPSVSEAEDKNSGSAGKDPASVAVESPRPAQARGFSGVGPFRARRFAPGEYYIEGRRGAARFRVEGATFAEWVARALTEYDKCLDTIEAHLDDCFGCERDTYEWNEREGDNDTIPCPTCVQLDALVLVRHNAEIELQRTAKRNEPEREAES